MSSGMPSPALTSALSADRFGRYLAATPNPAAALELYEWNARLSAAVMHLTGMVEVTARSAMDAQLVTWYAHSPGEWWDSGRLDHRGTKDVTDAKRRAGRCPSHGRVVAELNFGFWRFLVGSRYLTTFWIPALQAGFDVPAGTAESRRAWVECRMQALHFVRNRAAHHEPLFQRDVWRDERMAFELADSVHLDVGAWMRQQSMVGTVLSERPRPRRESNS